MTGEIVAEMVPLDDLYHPHTLEHYDPECCCAYCLDVSIGKARRGQAEFYRKLRRAGQGKMARLCWKKLRAAEKSMAISIGERLFSSSGSVSGRQIGGLQSLFGD
jgi:hypothetical protein